MKASRHRGQRPGTAPRGAAGGWRLWLGLAAGLLVLNFALTFHNVWPTPWITTHHELSVELAALVLALALYSEAVRVPSPRLMTALAVVLLVLALGRYAEVTAPALYGRRVNLYWDAPHVLNVVSMLRVAAALPTVALAVAGLIALVAAAFAAIRWSLARVRAGLGFAPARRTLAALAGGLVALYAAGYAPTPLRALRWFSLPVTATYWQQAEFTLGAYRQARNADESLCAHAPREYDLKPLMGADVLVMFMESYGATTYDRADAAAVIGPARERLAQAAAATGRGVVSAFVTSPTFGGASWLAHITLLTGRPVRDNGTYNLLLTQNCDVLTKAFARDGYRVVGLMPGLKRAWPEGAFYGFDAIYGERTLDYRGPDFGWWRVPDQYALAKLAAMDLGAEPRAPLFLFFPTISSHMPFRPTPPYQPDWSRVLTAQPYDPEVAAASLAVKPDWTSLGPDYAATIAYTFDYVAGFLRERPDLDLVLILLGDHQPAASVSGEGARWDVPVHVIASRAGLLEMLERAGFVAGVAPAPEPLGPMQDLTRVIFGARAAAGSPVPGEALRSSAAGAGRVPLGRVSRDASR